MILAAGLSPAWQQIVLLQELRLGEVNRAQEVHWCASGKVGNVAIALQHFGQGANHSAASSATALLTVRGGTTGESLQRELEAWKIDGRWVVIYSKYDLGCALEGHKSADCLGHDRESATRLASAVVLYSLRR